MPLIRDVITYRRWHTADSCQLSDPFLPATLGIVVSNTKLLFLKFLQQCLGETLFVIQIFLKMLVSHSRDSNFFIFRGEHDLDPSEGPVA